MTRIDFVKFLKSVYFRYLIHINNGSNFFYVLQSLCKFSGFEVYPAICTYVFERLFGEIVRKRIPCFISKKCMSIKTSSNSNSQFEVHKFIKTWTIFKVVHFHSIWSKNIQHHIQSDTKISHRLSATQPNNMQLSILQTELWWAPALGEPF